MLISPTFANEPLYRFCQKIIDILIKNAKTLVKTTNNSLLIYDVVASVKVPTVQTQVQDFGEFNSQHTFCKIKGESLILRSEARYICEK